MLRLVAIADRSHRSQFDQRSAMLAGLRVDRQPDAENWLGSGSKVAHCASTIRVCQSLSFAFGPASKLRMKLSIDMS